MNPYADVDIVITAWAKAIGFRLFSDGSDGQPSRFFHIPGDSPHECFQIVIFPPSADRIAVQAAAIDTNDDTEKEMLETWEGSVEELDALLVAAVATIDVWKRRHRHERA